MPYALSATPASALADISTSAAAVVIKIFCICSGRIDLLLHETATSEASTVGNIIVIKGTAVAAIAQHGIDAACSFFDQ